MISKHLFQTLRTLLIDEKNGWKQSRHSTKQEKLRQPHLDPPHSRLVKVLNNIPKFKAQEEFTCVHAIA